tara:strand:- start:1188 stop:1367 length:180 start_codon:yes stop_codon:yes gene_type:complete
MRSKKTKSTTATKNNLRKMLDEKNKSTGFLLQDVNNAQFNNYSSSFDGNTYNAPNVSFN